jgi:cohesin complex subunit SA-1/2
MEHSSVVEQVINSARSFASYSLQKPFQAFFCLCDILIMCNWKLKEANNRASELVVNLDAHFTNVINTFVVNNVFMVSQEDFDKLDQQSQIELTCKRRVVLGQYCKLITCGLLPIVDIAQILCYYQKNYADYGDIFKQVLTRCSNIDRLATANAMIRALKGAYENIKVTEGTDYVDPLSQQFSELRELAKKFSGYFSTEQAKNREAIALIHQIGIQHALGGKPYISFF